MVKSVKTMITLVVVEGELISADRRANFASCSKARRSFHVRFRSARAICIGALTSGSDEKG
jgi:hypothetical protein